MENPLDRPFKEDSVFTMPTQESPNLKQLYYEDEHLWYLENAKLIREGNFDLVDLEHIAEVLEDMGKRDYREVLSRMRILLMHLLKWIFQKEKRTNSWKASIVEQRKQLIAEFEDSKNLENHARINFQKVYKDAVDVATAETGLLKDAFPENPPFTFEQALDEDYLPE